MMAQAGIAASQEDFNGVKILSDFYTTNDELIFWDDSNAGINPYAQFCVGPGETFEFAMSLNVLPGDGIDTQVTSVSLLDVDDIILANSRFL